MENPNLRKWSYEQGLEGLLFFAQLIIEQIETFKIPALNTHHRCTEALSYIRKVERGFIPRGALESINEEFLWSFRNDPIIEGIFGEKRWDYYREVEKLKSNKKSPLRLVESHFRLIKGLLYGDNRYLEEAKKQLKESICNEPENRDRIYALTRSLLTELIFYGYSQDFIRKKTKQFFFDNGEPAKINSANQINQYLDIFNLKKEEFVVEFKTRTIPDFIRDLAEDENPPKGLEIEVGTKEGNTKNELPDFLRFKKIEALAPDRARDMAYERIELLATLVRYFDHTDNFVWDNMPSIKLPNNELLVLPSRVEAVYRRPDKMLAVTSSSPKDILDLIPKGQPTEQKDRKEIWQGIIWGLKLHEMAISAKKRDEQFLAFWYFMEGLLRPPSKGKMEYVISSVKPLLTANYPTRFIIHIKKDLERCLESNLTEIIDKIEIKANPVQKIAAIISIEDDPFKSSREEIISEIKKRNNVLLMDRFNYFNKILNSKKGIKSTIDRYGNLVDWHIHRMYRLRNLIVHSSERLRPLYYTDNLIANFHSYVDTIIELLIKTACENPNIKNIDDAISKINLDFQAHYELLSGQDANCTLKNYKTFIFGVS